MKWKYGPDKHTNLALKNPDYRLIKCLRNVSFQPDGSLVESVRSEILRTYITLTSDIYGRN
jgi:hypothetical protein